MNESKDALAMKLITLKRRSRQQDEEIKSLYLSKGMDLYSNNREMLDESRASSLLGHAQEDMKAMRLSTKSFGLDAAKYAATQIAKMKSLTTADMSDIIAGRPEIEALEVLKVMVGALPLKSLKYLDLSENALGEKGIRALSPSLREINNLEEIKFMNTGLSELSIQLLSDCLPTENLSSLTFHNNMSGSGGAIAASDIINKTPNLKEFRMSSSRVQADGGLSMLKSLTNNADKLVKLNLSDSMFNQECSNQLQAMTPKLLHLTDLLLRDTGLCKQTVLDILLDTNSLPNLSILDLSGFEFEVEDGNLLGQIISQRNNLQKLWLDDNELESEGVINICKIARKSKSMLELISVKTNQMGSKGALALLKFAIANPSMKSIELDDNQISAAGVTKMEEILNKIGKQDLLGSLEENMESGDEDDDLDDEIEEDSDTLDELVEHFKTAL